MRILILGGTIFVGRHLARAALDRGHEVTLFNRALTAPDLFPEAERLTGDRNGPLDALQQGRWDAVIDTSGFLPRQVEASAGLLAARCDHYTFISSLSVYDDSKTPGQDEGAPLKALPDPSIQEVSETTYGGLKALCESAAEAALPGKVLVLRPGLIVGPHDPTDRFTYWPRRLRRGGEVLAPGDPERRVQYIDARDLASWTLDMVEKKKTGAYNVTGPPEGLTMAALIEGCRVVSGKQDEVTITWLDEVFLLDAGVRPFVELPMWLPREHSGLMQVDVSRAIGRGLKFRPLEETASDTLAWDESRDPDVRRRAGLGPARELALLQAWHAHQAVKT